jgi:L-ascorbate metabolism protein UlaG (beta-lactamase superfamily)
MSHWRLADSAQLSLSYDDRTPFGSALTGGIDRRVRAAIPRAAELRRAGGMAAVVKAGVELLREAHEGALGQLHVSPERLREECLFPPFGEVRPVRLSVRREGMRPLSLPLGPGMAADLACWVSDWQRGGPAPRQAEAATLWQALRDGGALAGDAEPPAYLDGPALFVGHATVRLGSRGSSVLVDPFLLPRRERYQSYQPISHGQLQPDAILVTHSHPDHFDPATLLRFGPEIPILVPEVDRESILAIDMAARLRQLGFARVRTLRWGEEATVGSTRILALPFFGEQPTTSSVLHPSVRNMGNVYLVETEGKRYALCADCGADRDGDIRFLASETRRRQGPVDVVFGGYRSWATYPISYLFQSVTRYLLFVPPEQWGVRQSIMNDGERAIDTAEAWGATALVPYADGGAPWYWDIGLGPDLSGGTIDSRSLHIDPPPECVVEAARRRSSWGAEPIPSPVAVALLRPGDGLVLSGQAALRQRNQGHEWPHEQERIDSRSRDQRQAG